MLTEFPFNPLNRNSRHCLLAASKENLVKDKGPSPSDIDCIQGSVFPGQHMVVEVSGPG